ncbi:MAG: hypothetical protein ACOCVF_00800 [bacterium]
MTIKDVKKDKLTREDFNNAIKTINCYYRQITGRKECLDFYLDFIQPLKRHIKGFESYNNESE